MKKLDKVSMPYFDVVLPHTITYKSNRILEYEVSGFGHKYKPKFKRHISKPNEYAYTWPEEEAEFALKGINNTTVVMKIVETINNLLIDFIHEYKPEKVTWGGPHSMNLFYKKYFLRYWRENNPPSNKRIKERFVEDYCFGIVGDVKLDTTFYLKKNL